MKCFAKIVNYFLPLIFLAKHSILDIWQGSDKCHKVYKDNIKLKTKCKQKAKKKQKGKTKNKKRTSFPKEQIKNTDLCKPVLNKIMTTQKNTKKFVKHNFGAPLKRQKISLNQGSAHSLMHFLEHIVNTFRWLWCFTLGP